VDVVRGSVDSGSLHEVDGLGKGFGGNVQKDREMGGTTMLNNGSPAACPHQRTMHNKKVNRALSMRGDARRRVRKDNAIVGNNSSTHRSDVSRGGIEVTAQNKRLAAINKMT
jgi:hypothetical protein